MALPASYLDEFAEPFGYVDFASVGPVSQRVAGALEQAWAGLHAPAANPVQPALDAWEDGRARFAALLGLEPRQVSVLPSTSAALFQVAFGLPPGNVVVPAHEFPANLYPWLRAEERGGPEVRLVEAPDHRVTPELIAAAVDGGTVAVSVSLVDYRTGFRTDVAALREVVGDALLIVDAIQGAGAVRFPAAAADVVAGGGQKWLRAGFTAGWIGVSDRARERLAPTLTGWTGVEGFLDTDVPPPHPVRDDADRFHQGSLPLFGAVALGAAADVVGAAGLATIEQAVLARAAALEEVVRRAGAEVLAPWRSPGERAGIVCFRLPAEEPAATAERLRAAGLVFSERGRWLRLAPHASTPPEVAGLLSDALAVSRPARSTRIPSR